MTSTFQARDCRRGHNHPFTELRSEYANKSQFAIVIELSYGMFYIPTCERIFIYPWDAPNTHPGALGEEGTMNPRTNVYRFTRVALAVVAVVSIAATVQGQDPVEVSFEVTGSAVPGGTVQVTANVTINDGSTLQSYSWMQVGGADASLSGTNGQTVTVNLPPRADYKEYLIHVLMEPPITEEQLPPNVPSSLAASKIGSRSWPSIPLHLNTPQPRSSRSRSRRHRAPTTPRSTFWLRSRGRSPPVCSTCRSECR
jgi:hypothetical protein